MEAQILRRAACAAVAMLPAFAAAAAADDRLVFDTIISQTGPGAFLGGSQRQMMELTEGVINHAGGVHGKPVHFAFRDDQTSPQVAVQLLNDVIASHPPVVFGSIISAICNAMSPLLQSGPVQYCFSPSVSPAPGGYVFTSDIASHDQQRALLRYFRAKGWTRIALITTTDASGQDADRNINALAKEPDYAGITLVEDVYFNATDVSIGAQIARIQAANPQAVISWATAAAGATVFRALKQAGIDLPVAASASNMTWGQMTEYAAFLPRQIFFGASGWAAAGDPEIDLAPGVLAQQKQFFATVRAAGIHPDAGVELGWDPPLIIAAALNALPPGASAAELHYYLERLRGYDGIDGTYDFTRVKQRGLDVSDALVIRWNAERKNWDPVSKRTGIPLKQ